MSTRPYRVLMVEDSAADAALIEAHLRGSHAARFECERASDLQGARQWLASGAPLDVIVLDLSLPDSRGIDTLRQVLELNPEGPVVVLSGAADEQTAVRAIQLGAQDALAKDQINGQILPRTLRAAIERARLEKAHAELSAAVEACDDAIIGIDSQGCISTWNGGAARTYEYSAQEMLGAPITLLAPEHRRGEMLTAVERLRAGEHIRQLETVHVTRSGGTRLVSLSLSPVIDPGGGVRGGVVVGRDITANMQLLSELRMSEDRFFRLVRHAADAIFVVDEQGRFIHANYQAERSLGYTNAELQEKQVSDIQVSLGENVARDVWGRLASEDAVTVRGRHRRKDGSTFPVEVRVGRFEFDGQECLLAIARDLTDREQMESSLRQRQEHLRLLSGQLPAFFWTTDRALRITSALGAAVGGSFASAADVVGVTLQDYLADNDAAAEVTAAHHAALEGRASTIDIRWGDKLHRARIEPLRQDGSEIVGAIGVALDITEQKLVQIELGEARQISRGYPARRPPSIEGFDIAGLSQACDAAGGDFFDYLRLPDGATAIAICDVGGHGLGPAMLMAATRAYLRALCQSQNDPAEILTRLNATLCGDSDQRRLVALFLARLEPRKRQLSFASAGHRSLMLRRGGEHEVLYGTGLPLIVVEDCRYEQNEPISLESGDIVLLYTDGLVEASAAGQSPFGSSRLLETVRKNRHLSAEAIVASLFQAVQAHAPQALRDDDMTAVVIKAL